MSERPAPVRRGIATNVTLDTDAKAVLEHYAPAKTQGRFLSRLLYEYHARQEERDRLKDKLAEVLRHE